MMCTNGAPVIGIDLGTTHCCVGILNSDNHVDIIENAEGFRTTPSYVAFTDNDEIIGNSAKETVFRNPENVIYDSKRLIGRTFDDKCIQNSLSNWSFNVTDANNKPVINILRKGEIVYYKPHEISALLLKYMKTTAEQSLDCKINDAVVTVPAYFNYHQRVATKEAGKLAGLNVLKIVNEPTAAALAYIHKHKINDCKNLLVFDLGGGTFDVTLLEVYHKSVIIRATCGNTHLGGRDFDRNLANFIKELLKEQYGPDVLDRKVMQRIRAKSERVKIQLSTQKVAYLDFLNLLNDCDVSLKISRDSFEKVNENLFRRCIQTVDNCLKDAKINRTDVEKIVLIGGSTRIPKLQDMLRNFFGGKDLSKAINPDEAVAYGAAIQAALHKIGDKQEAPMFITEVTPLSLGTDILGERMNVIISRNTPIPVTKTVSYLTTVDKQTKMCFNIYEGERSLVKYNNNIGTTTIPLPPKPPGYCVDVTFHIDKDGILEVRAKTETGLYSTLKVEYNYHNDALTSNVIQDAQEHRIADQRKYDVVTEWSKLNEYCTKIKAVCNYDKRNMTNEERGIIKQMAEEGLEWLEDNQVKIGNQQEKMCILHTMKEISNTCEPILNRYGYRIKNISIDEFYNLIS